MGQTDVANQKPVKLYCARCEDVYNPKSSRHAAIDGAYFGTSFHNIMFQVYPALVPPRSAERYVPRVYGFRVHASAALVRWQNGRRTDMLRRLRKMQVESGFKGEDGEDEELDDDDEEEEDDDDEIDPVAGSGARAALDAALIAGGVNDGDGDVLLQDRGAVEQDQDVAIEGDGRVAV
jgi:hypothetical protein